MTALQLIAAERNVIDDIFNKGWVLFWLILQIIWNLLDSI